jgi:hypothetical protein
MIHKWKLQKVYCFRRYERFHCETAVKTLDLYDFRDTAWARQRRT